MLATLAPNPHAECPVQDRALLSDHYENNSSPRNQADLRSLQAASAAAYAWHGDELESHRFGNKPWQSFDVFRPTVRPTRALVFVHGGRWQLNTSRETAFWAEACCDSGLLFVGLNFPSLKDAGLLAQVHAVSTAIAAALAFTDQQGIARGQVCLAGHSSGAHLALAALLPTGSEEAPAFAAGLGALLLLGGIYDLGPLRRTSHQRSLEFSEQDVERASPIRLLAQRAEDNHRVALPRTLVAVGADETPEFVRQARALHWILQWHAPAAWHAVRGAAHFDAALEFNAPRSVLRQFAVRHEP
jgi:arylformamidase